MSHLLHLIIEQPTIQPSYTMLVVVVVVVVVVVEQ